jgi:HK97 family phage portal protein
MISPEEEFTEEQIVILRDQLNSDWQGTGNTGSIVIMPSSNVKFQPFSISPKDMDFLALMESMKANIYNSLNIPLPLVTTDAATFNNYSSSMLQLYTDVIFLSLDNYINELTNFLLPRFKKDKLVLSYDKSKIPAVEDRNIAIIEKKAKLGVMEINEIRAQLGLEQKPEYNVLVKPVNNSVNNDKVTQSEQLTSDKFDDKIEAEEFLEALKRNGYSDSEIMEKAKLYYGTK